MILFTLYCHFHHFSFSKRPFTNLSMHFIYHKTRILVLVFCILRPWTLFKKVHQMKFSQQGGNLLFFQYQMALINRNALWLKLLVFFSSSQGRWSSLFLFFRKHLKWSVIQYSRYTTILGVFGLLAQYLFVPFLSNFLKLHDTTISLLDVVTRYVNWKIKHTTYNLPTYLIFM